MASTTRETDSSFSGNARFPLLANPREVAQLLCVSPRTLRAWRGAGRLPLPVVDEGKLRLWSVPELTAWVAAGCPRLAAWQKGAS